MGGFGGTRESCSGVGSTINNTSTIRKILPDLLKKINAKSIIDAPCGDFNWMQNIDLDNILYTGVDIVNEIVKKNIKAYAGCNQKFFVHDIVKDILPYADVILSRDCFIHLSNKDIIQSVLKFKKSGSRYLLTNTYSITKNEDMVSGRGYRPINLLLPPFNFPEPLLSHKENELVEEKNLALWPLENIFI